MQTDSSPLLRRIRITILFFMMALALSGITAFPIVWEINTLLPWLNAQNWVTQYFPDMLTFLNHIHEGVNMMNASYKFIFYGTDWLAFAHIVIAIAFIGPLKDPVRNKWVIDFGIINCLLIFPLAFIMGPLRDIPLIWRIIDCSFGIFGLIPLFLVRRWIQELEIKNSATQ